MCVLQRYGCRTCNWDICTDCYVEKRVRIRINQHTNTRTHDTRTHEHTNTRTHEHTNTRTHEHTNNNQQQRTQKHKRANIKKTNLFAQINDQQQIGFFLRVVSSIKKKLKLKVKQKHIYYYFYYYYFYFYVNVSQIFVLKGPNMSEGLLAGATTQTTMFSRKTRHSDVLVLPFPEKEGEKLFFNKMYDENFMFG